ncbi:hypothetical protein ACF3MZ_27880 [Paenibacillaceae bacterium WGS1546]|uniref:hypothetical protein n=1 Tax=Cohnella sp. WGS1546 TaxID=3366810 RepID=UPI00372D7DD9
MARPKSFLKSIEVDEAKREHKCQHIPSHQISKSERRLKLKVDRTFEHFCVDCAIKTIEADIAKLQNIKLQLTNEVT